MLISIVQISIVNPGNKQRLSFLLDWVGQRHLNRNDYAHKKFFKSFAWINANNIVIL